MKTRSIISIGIVLFSTIIIYSCQKEITFKNSENNTVDYFVSKQDASKYSEILSNSLRIQSLKSAAIAKTFSAKTIKNVTTILDDMNTAAIYIINYEGGGFTLLSADKRFSPIFGFSDCNSFPIQSELRPAALELMLNALKEKIKIVRKNNSSPTKLVQQEWINLEANSTSESLTPSTIQPPPDPEPCVDFNEQGGPLLSTQWTQGIPANLGIPYNLYAPTRASYGCDGFGNFLAGCSTIALGQIMKYHQKPTSYNWSSITGPSNSTAQLIGDIIAHLPVEKDCESNGLSTQIIQIPAYFKDSIGYSSAVYDGYNYSLVLSELRINKPVYLDGNDGVNHGTWLNPRYIGHAWVADGFIHNIICMYDNYGVFIGTASYLYFHMNWGFEGVGDGYYGFSNFSPIINGIQKDYNHNVKMVYNIRP